MKPKIPQFGKRGARPPAIKIQPSNLKPEEIGSKPLIGKSEVLMAAFAMFILSIITTGVVIWPAMRHSTWTENSNGSDHNSFSGGSGFLRQVLYGGFGKNGSMQIGRAAS